MATLVNRTIRFTNESGEKELAMVVSQSPAGNWIKVIRADGSHYVLHASEPIEVAGHFPNWLEQVKVEQSKP